MCGIAGFFGAGEVLDHSIEKTLELMKRRGPDHRAFMRLKDGSLCGALLHSRLSIIDLDPRSNQPMSFGGCTIVFNGEIYNYVELRRELEREGDRFETSSDTEVLLKNYLRYGLNGMSRLEGMWAFAMYDPRLKKMILSRDRMGEKPLFYRQDAAGVYFGSEPKFIFELSGERSPINHDQIRRYLVNGYKSLHKTTDTFFEGLREVPAAHTVSLGETGVESQKRYWELSYQPEPMSYDEAVAGTAQRLEESLRIRLRADVPLAFCLSGGVDSSALVSLAQKKLGCHASTFSIVDEDARYDETVNIQKTVRDLGCANTTIRTSREGFWERMRELVTYHDAPVATVSYYVHSYLSEAIARGGFKIAVSGSGADELFTGYFDHFNLFLRETQNEPEFEAHVLSWQKSVGRVVRNPYLQNPRLFIEKPDFRGHIYLDRDVFASYLRKPFQEDFTETHYSASLLRNRMLNELFHEVMPVILREDDLNSMYYSIENRSPYLDSRLAEFAYRIPSKHLMRDGRAKSVLRDAVKGVLNEEVRMDPHKKGFNASILSFVDPADADVRRLLCEDSPVFEIVDRARVEAMLSGDFVQNSFSKFLFSFISAKIFMEAYA